MSEIVKRLSAWTCDERHRAKGQCRNSHGCHCAEITAQREQITRLEAEVSRLNNLAQEGRKAGLEEAVTRLAKTGDFAGANEVRALIPQEQGEKGK